MPIGRLASALALLLLAPAAAALATASSAGAQAWPEKPIRLVIPYSPGGGNDVIAHPIAARLAERLGRLARLRRSNPRLFAHSPLCHGHGRASGAV